MKNQDKWKPSRWKFNSEKNRFEPNLLNIYPGSVHIAWLQVRAYAPLIKEHIKGRLLDCGCDTVPFFEMYRNQVQEVVCTDWETTRKENPYVDFYSNLNEKLPIESESFDSILMTEVIAHILKPGDLILELSRILKPGGKIFISTIFINWIAEPPHEYNRCSEYALRTYCENAGLKVLHMESYGGRADVLLDTINKGLTGKWSNRFFRLFRSLVIMTKWYKTNKAKTTDRYPIGYALVAEKIK